MILINNLKIKTLFGREEFLIQFREKFNFLIKNLSPSTPNWGIIFLLAVLFFSCQKEEVGPQLTDTNSPFKSAKNQVLILNEGTFNFGNASISSYNIDSFKVQNNVFQTANNRPLGDILHSGTLINNSLYLSINNSAKIEVIDTANFKSRATISGFASPRFITSVSSTKAYVTNFNSNNIQVVDLTTNRIAKTINVSGRSEQMLLFNNNVYVTKYAGELLMINPINDSIEATIKLTIGCQNLVLDKNNMLWVMCDGSFTGDPLQTTAILYKINPVTNTIISQFRFNNINDSPSKLTIDGTKENLYFINSGVYKMNISDVALPSQPIIKSESRQLYGLGVHPTNNNIFIADAVDYVQKGTVYMYSETGTELHNFKVGVTPNGFVFSK